MIDIELRDLWKKLKFYPSLSNFLIYACALARAGQDSTLVENFRQNNMARAALRDLLIQQTEMRQILRKHVVEISPPDNFRVIANDSLAGSFKIERSLLSPLPHILFFLGLYTFRAIEALDVLNLNQELRRIRQHSPIRIDGRGATITVRNRQDALTEAVENVSRIWLPQLNTVVNNDPAVIGHSWLAVGTDATYSQMVRTQPSLPTAYSAKGLPVKFKNIVIPHHDRQGFDFVLWMGSPITLEILNELRSRI